MTTTSKILAQNVTKTFITDGGGELTVLDDLSIEIAAGEFVSIIGPSGCGKSTFLRMLAELETVTSGTLDIRQTDHHRPAQNVVFQEYAIFPWRTVRENVAFGLEMRGIPKNERIRLTNETIRAVGLEKFADYYPGKISGGMKQRVGIARALANDPEVLLMDEPLGALDAQTRNVLQEEILRIHESTGKTILYITHSIDEAVLLSNRVAVMTIGPGRIKEVVDIDLPWPRSLETLKDPKFAELRDSIWLSLRDEVMRAMEMER